MATTSPDASSSEATTPTVMTSAAPADGDRPSARLYRVVWRWHFYAGVFVIPILVLLCLTGIVYLFRPQLETLQYGDAMHVHRGQSVVSYQKQVDAALGAHPGSTVYELGTPVSDRHATQVSLNTENGKDLTVWVNPYTGEVTGERDNGRDLANLALELHGTLMTERIPGLSGPEDAPGKWGDRLIEIAAGWAVVLVVTGTYLFWPRRRKDGSRGWRQAFQLRRGSGNRRLLWRDIHAVTGVLFSFVTLFFLVTGLMWSGFWGVKYSEVLTTAGTSYPEGIWDGASSVTGDSLQRTAKGGWISNSLPLFPSGARPQIAPEDVKPGYVGDPDAAAAASGHEGHTGAGTGASTGTDTGTTPPGGDLRWNPADGAPIDAVVATALEAGITSGFPISYPSDATGSYSIWLSADGSPFNPRGATGERQMYIDQYTAEVIRDFPYSGFGIGAKVSDLGIVLHEGRQFGLGNQLLTLVGTLAILVSIASSIVMWVRRRPKSGLGAPARGTFASRRQGMVVVAIAVGLGALFPLLGLTMLVLLAVDLLLIRTIAPLRRAFG